MKITTQITARDRLLLALLFIIVILAGAVNYLILPALNRKADLEVELGDLRTQKTEMAAIIASGEGAVAELTLAQQQLAAVIESLPVAMSNQELDTLITGLELRCNLFPTALTIQEAKETVVLPYNRAAEAAKLTGGSLLTAMLNLKCSGSQTDFLRFMDLLSAEYEYIRLTKFAVTDAIDEVGAAETEISCSFEVYMYQK
ncbi:MAG: hypothetical protein LLG09_02510 [Negativicutes bacterium]|nr:hypothetical protein [Negativicutes bacterium]